VEYLTNPYRKLAATCRRFHNADAQLRGLDIHSPAEGDEAAVKAEAIAYLEARKAHQAAIEDAEAHMAAGGD
jgi:hypothetical protein